MATTSQEEVDYKQKYRSLKRKLRFLIYEQECFHEELRRSQRKLLKVSRDKSFLLDRLMQYERVEESASSAESTESSDAETKKAAQEKKQKKKAKKRKRKLTQVKPIHQPDDSNSDKTPLLANLAFSSTLTQQMSQQIAELMSQGTSNLPGSVPSSSSSQPFAGLGTAGKQSHSTVHPSSGNQPSGPIGPSQTGNILERALQPGGHSSQSATTSSSLQHTAIQTKKKIKREPGEIPRTQGSIPQIKREFIPNEPGPNKHD